MTDLTLVRELVEVRLDLDHQIASVLIKLELISYGSTTAWNSSGGESGEPDDKIISQVTQISRDTPRHLHYRDMYARAGTDGQRRRVIQAAEEELHRIQHQSRTVDAVMSHAEIDEQRILREGPGWTAKECARALNCPIGTVRQVRREHTCDPETGLKVLDTDITSDTQAIVVALAARGLTQKQIAMMTDLSQQRVSQILQFNRGQRVAA